MRFCTVIFVIIFFGFMGCKKRDIACKLSEEIIAIPLDVKITRMEQEIYQELSRENFQYLLEKHPQFTKQYLEEDLYENKEDMVNSLFLIYGDSNMMDLYQEVQLHFGEISELEEEIENAFKYILHYYPEFKVPEIYTHISGFSSDLFFSDDIIVIGLDYFLPSDHPYQPLDLPLYISKRYEKEYLVPTLITAISSRFNETDLNDNTMLAEMIFYGKAYHFTKAVLPCTPDEFIIGYSAEDIANSYANEELIWAHFIEHELLFETNPFLIKKYTGEAPFTDEISRDAPGRLGRWIGWNIVDDYVFGNNLGLVELMGEDRAGWIFRQSGYKPRR